MEITLKDLLNEDEVRGIINAAVDDILRQVITLNVGTNVGTLPTVTSSKPSYTCEICGQAGFTAKASLGGHQYWKHDISNKMTVEEVRAKKAASKAAKEATANVEEAASQSVKQAEIRAQAETE